MYRPWGLLDLSLELTAPKNWSFVGAFGTEKRSLAAWKWLRQLGYDPSYKLLLIQDQPSRHSATTRSIIEERKAGFLADNGDVASIVQFDLLDELFKIKA